MSWSVLPMFSSKCFIVSDLTFRSLIHLGFILVYGECRHFNIYFRVGLVLMNQYSFSFFLSEFFSSPLILNYNLAGQGILSCRVFPFSALKMSWHSLLVCKLSTEKLADIFMGPPLHMTLFFSCCLQNSLFFHFFHFNCYVLVCLFCFLLLGTHCSSYNWTSISFFRFGNFSVIISSDTFSTFLSPSPSLFSFWNPNNVNVAMLDIIPKIS